MFVGILDPIIAAYKWIQYGDAIDKKNPYFYFLKMTRPQILYLKNEVSDTKTQYVAYFEVSMYHKPGPNVSRLNHGVSRNLSNFIKKFVKIFFIQNNNNICIYICHKEVHVRRN